MVRGILVAKRVTWAIPGDIETVSGGYAYDRRIIAELQAHGWEVELVSLGDGFPRPTAVQKESAEALLIATANDRPIVLDGLAFGALPEIAAELHRTRPVVALVHHPLSLETGLMPDVAEQLFSSERAALVSTRKVIVTSEWTAAVLVDQFDVPAERLSVVLPGIDRPKAAIRRRDGALRLLSVGTIVPRKGFDILVEAVAQLMDLPWQLTIAGDRSRDVAEAARLDRVISRYNLNARVEVLGKVSPDHLQALYRDADLFVSATHFEGYGMAFAEAMVSGLPIVGTTGGAIPQTVPSSAGRLVPPGNAAALSDALRELIKDDGHRKRLAVGALEEAAKLPSWSVSGTKFSALLALLT
jgi:glycosyltransferase involved in cell wall biosynthesis